MKLYLTGAPEESIRPTWFFDGVGHVDPQKEATVSEQLRQASKEDLEKVAAGFWETLGGAMSPMLPGHKPSQTGGQFSTSMGPRALQIASHWQENPGARAKGGVPPRAGAGPKPSAKPSTPKPAAGGFGKAMAGAGRGMSGATKPGTAAAAPKPPKATP